ncbi:MAG TPA: cytidine deaminase [Gemmatimonadaceae bacterium]|nr:cytidine deaminase [Gemmatimonadaceae bacterium]
MTDAGNHDSLRAAALRAVQSAYAPYSRFRVGAALRAADGRVFTGCNVENASYGGAICAERGAVMAAVAAGAREFTDIVVATEAGEPTPPCGLCRQFLVEFAPRLTVTSVTSGGAVARWTLADLLPHAFTPAALHRAGAP